MTAYQKMSSFETIDHHTFYQLIQDFSDEYLSEYNYQEKIKHHRNPVEINNALLSKIYEDLNRIQQRPELQDIDTENKTHGYVHIKIAEIWNSDKRLKSLYSALNAYVILRSSDLKTIAIHIAEFRGLYNLMKRLRRKIRLSESAIKNVNRAIGDMYIIKPTSVVDSLEGLKNGNLVPINADAFGIHAYDTFPVDGYNEHPGFPYCCSYHTSLFQIGLNEYTKFPDCCIWHRELKNASWFNKQNYSYLPIKLVKTMSYTIHCIELALEKQSWYKEIVDYVEHTINSYGQLPEGYGSPVGLKLYQHNLRYHIEYKFKDDAVKKEKLLDFLEGKNEKEKGPEIVEINLLIAKYKQWLKIFPFQLSIFHKAKSYFENTMPILKDIGEPNIYTGLTRASILTKGELIKFLTSATRVIITELNSVKMFEENKLTDLKKLRLELTVQERKLELHELDSSDWNDKSQYIKLLKKWFKGEQKFIKEIEPILAQSQSQINIISAVIEGIKLLQNHDVNEPCIRSVKDNKGDREAGFQYWFKTFLTGRLSEFNITSEEAKGYGKIDLKIANKKLGTYIIEFKGWWNNDRFQSPEQLCAYLTDFEKGGYIFMINHLKTKAIGNEYKSIVTNSKMKFVEGSWKELTFENSDYTYFESRHKFGINEKIIHHFIFNVYS